MKTPDIDDLSRFLNELNRETDRGLPLVSAALIEEKLHETLYAFFCRNVAAKRLLDEAHAPLGTFSARIDACFALGLIDEFEYREINQIRKIRNEFAHAKHGLSFENERIKSLCSSLRSEIPSGAEDDFKHPRQKFANAAVNIVLRLYYRSAYVSKEQREPRSWIEQGTLGWRSVEEEAPPEGTPVIAFVKRPKR